MHVTKERLETLFRKADQVAEEMRAYCIGGDNTAVSIEDLVHVVGQMYTRKIEKYRVSTKTEYVQSLILSWDNGRVAVLVKGNSTDDEAKYFIAKEISHVILDEKEDWSIDASSRIDSLIDVARLDIQTNGEHEVEDRAIVNEHLAEYLAIELIYPHDVRNSDYVALTNGEITYAALAVRYRVPVRIIETAHKEWYRDLCAEFRSK